MRGSMLTAILHPRGGFPILTWLRLRKRTMVSSSGQLSLLGHRGLSGPGALLHLRAVERDNDLLSFSQPAGDLDELPVLEPREDVLRDEAMASVRQQAGREAGRPGAASAALQNENPPPLEQRVRRYPQD